VRASTARFPSTRNTISSPSWMPQNDFRNPHDAHVRVDAVPDATACGDLPLPLRKLFASDRTGCEVVLELCRASRVIGPVQWSGSKSFEFCCHQFGLGGHGPLPLFARFRQTCSDPCRDSQLNVVERGLDCVGEAAVQLRVAMYARSLLPVVDQVFHGTQARGGNGLDGVCVGPRELNLRIDR